MHVLKIQSTYAISYGQEFLSHCGHGVTSVRPKLCNKVITATEFFSVTAVGIKRSYSKFEFLPFLSWRDIDLIV